MGFQVDPACFGQVIHDERSICDAQEQALLDRLSRLGDYAGSHGEPLFQNHLSAKDRRPGSHHFQGLGYAPGGRQRCRVEAHGVR